MPRNISKKITGRKKIILIVCLIILLALPIILYFVFKEKESDQWYSSDWNFRRSIVIENDSNTKILNEEVLVEIDTESLIKDGKMQGDCDDLRFLDSDNETNLDFWIEGGCNTKNTQIWIQIPSLLKDGKVIYSYYGNEKAPNSEMLWNGKFLMFSDSTECSEGWEKAVEYNGKFLLGADVAGSKGGSNTHNHDDGIILLNESFSSAECSGDCIENVYIDDTYSISLSESENIPPYFSLLACKSNNLSFSNQISYFDTLKFPDGWKYLSDTEGKFIMAAAVASLTGGREEHTHTIKTLSSKKISSLTYKYSNYIGSADIQDTDSGDLINTYVSSGKNIPEYEILTIAESNNTKKHGTDNMILATTELPPLGWEYYEKLEGKFPLVGTNIGKTGGSNTHSHTIKTSSISSSFGKNVSENFLKLSSFNTSLSEESNIPEYVTVIYAKRKTSLNISVKEEEENAEKENNSSVTGAEDTKENESDVSDTDVKGASTSAPTDLLTEGQANATNVGDPTPEFSAIFNDPDTGDTGVYYQIQLDFFPTLPSPIWDSGKTPMTATTSGFRCPEISYSGPGWDFSGGPVYWRIKFWDDDGNETPWSYVTSFIVANGAEAINMLVDGQSDPTFLNSASPTFSATYYDGDGDDCSAYQVQVYDHFFIEDSTIYWDSGKVPISLENLEEFSIKYKGLPLTNSGTTLYWEITFWDVYDVTKSTTDSFRQSFIDSYPSFTFEGLGLEGIQIN